MAAAPLEGAAPVNRKGAARSLAAAAIIVAATLGLYRAILFVPAGQPRYPWGSDTLGHVFRAEYVGQQLARGNAYPGLLPGWYMGLELFRAVAVQVVRADQMPPA